MTGGRDCTGDQGAVQMLVYADGWTSSGWELAVVKAALAAFGDSAAGFPAVAASSPPTFEVQVVETDEALMPPSWAQSGEQVLAAALDGAPPDCATSRGAPQVAIGAASSLANAEEFASLAESRGIPTVGFESYTGDAASGSLQDMSAYSQYSSAQASSVYTVQQAVKFAASRLGASSVNFWYCNDEAGHYDQAAAAEEAAAQGVALASYMIEQDAASYYSSAAPSAWSTLASDALSSGNTVNILADMGSSCYKWDLVNYLYTQGLMDQGNIWLGPGDATASIISYKQRRAEYPSDLSDYTSITAIDFFIFLQLEEAGTLASTTESTAISYIGESNRASHLEVWVAERVPDKAYELADAAARQKALYLFDAVYAAQYAATLALEAYGSGFSSAQFLEQLATVDLNLATGRLAMDTNVKRVQSISLAQYQEPGTCDASGY